MNASPSIYAAAVALALLLVAPPLEAQDTRADLVEAARNEFDPAAKMELLARAADPGAAPLDSLWAVAVYDLAAALLEQGEDEMASTWLRWGARHGTWPIDRNWYAPAVVEAYDEAVSTGTATAPADDPRASTSWRWPDQLDVDAPGVVEAEAADPSGAVSVEVEGQGAVAAGGALSLEPGTYEMVATAEGYETARVTREVLPGATTVLGFDLVPLLPADVMAGVSGSLVRVRFIQGGQQRCTSGLIARPDGLVLTSYGALQDVSGLEVVRGDNVYGGVTLAAGDPQRNLAVLRFGARNLPVLATATEADADQYVWSVHHPGCDAATSARGRLAAWDPPAAASLDETLPADALGAPVVDRQGSLLGVVVGSDRVAPLSSAADLLNEAVADLTAAAEDEQVAGDGGGGFPVAWVGAGAAAVGVAALLLGGGGGDGGGNGGGNDTGGIIVTFPGGGS